VKIAATFVTSAADAGGFPRGSVPELAMVGRSNVGKSSLINALVRQTLARTRAAPGKTRLVNFFRVEAGSVPVFHLVDLPGYGYARGGADAKREFETVTTAYFNSRAAGPPLPTAAVLLLVDSRHPGLEADRRAWAWLAATTLPRHVVAMKVDKLTQAERQRHLRDFSRIHDGPVTAVSAVSGEGLDELWRLIARLLRQPPPETAPPPPTR